MALALYDRVRETTTVLGTNDAVLLGAVTGYQSFAAVGNGNTCYYTIADTSGNWEVGLGTYSTVGPTLARTTVYSSSNSNTKVSFPAGTKDVFLTYVAEKALQYDASGNITITGNVTANNLASSNATITGGSINGAPVGNSSTSTGYFTTVTASADSSFTSTGALLISKGTTGQQPGSPATGMIRYNTSNNEFEGYSGASPAWKSIGGSAISNDTSTASFEYPLFAAATSGTALTIYTSNANYLYKPSTGELQSVSFLASNGIICNAQTVNTSYTLPTDYNAISAGPVTVASGVTVTVPTGATWVIA